MKFFLGLLIMAGGMGAAFYYTGAFESASAECDKTMAKMKDCSTIDEVLAIAEPDKASIYENYPYTFSDGSTRDEWKPGPEEDFNRPRIEQLLDDGMLEGGVAFIYIYSNADSFEVKIGPEGKVQYVQEQTGVRNLPGN